MRWLTYELILVTHHANIAAVGIKLAECCIYTMRHTSDLQRVASEDGAGAFFENKAWVTGSRLFGQAHAVGERLPIVFSAAEDWSGLIFWGVLTGVSVDSGDTDLGRKPRTDYSFEQLRPIEPSRPLSDLTLANARRPLSNESIRPYAICLTPPWLHAAP
jgi:hypothetical protein